MSINGGALTKKHGWFIELLKEEKYMMGNT